MDAREVIARCRVEWRHGTGAWGHRSDADRVAWLQAADRDLVALAAAGYRVTATPVTSARDDALAALETARANARTAEVRGIIEDAITDLTAEGP